VNGIYTDRVDPSKRYRKIIATGLGRSGTSSIGSLLHHVGYYLGEPVKDYERRTYESSELKHLLLDDEIDRCAAALNERASQHQRYAWKEPKIISSKGMELMPKLDDDWLVIVTFRDAVASSQRRSVSDELEFMDALKLVVEAQSRLLRFCLKCEKPLLFVSYEYFITKTREAITELVSYIEHDDSKVANIDELILSLLADREGYRAQAKSKKRL
jgi:hypothetical protein